MMSRLELKQIKFKVYKFFQCKKCGEENCKLCKPLQMPKEEFANVKHLPDPMSISLIWTVFVTGTTFYTVQHYNVHNSNLNERERERERERDRERERESNREREIEGEREREREREREGERGGGGREREREEGIGIERGRHGEGDREREVGGGGEGAREREGRREEGRDIERGKGQRVGEGAQTSALHQCSSCGFCRSASTRSRSSHNSFFRPAATGVCW